MKKVTSLLLLCAIAFNARSQSVGKRNRRPENNGKPVNSEEMINTQKSADRINWFNKEDKQDSFLLMKRLVHYCFIY